MMYSEMLYAPFMSEACVFCQKGCFPSYAATKGEKKKRKSFASYRTRQQKMKEKQRSFALLFTQNPIQLC